MKSEKKAGRTYKDTERERGVGETESGIEMKNAMEIAIKWRKERNGEEDKEEETEEGRERKKGIKRKRGGKEEREEERSSKGDDG